MISEDNKFTLETLGRIDYNLITRKAHLDVFPFITPDAIFQANRSIAFVRFSQKRDNLIVTHTDFQLVIIFCGYLAAANEQQDCRQN
ncbi:hypothetical protein DSCW_29470 [Desulfosarcina widdelii]|uniref:Uncharacterized protein n=1 Tax=Desulfosarcina widdelii TaxID=947919 RepID=A0A5K7Z4B1_9BACT|nr:hypothetical protein DSCW_29470 [Desulfosarcina widdelii]